MLPPAFTHIVLQYTVFFENTNKCLSAGQAFLHSFGDKWRKLPQRRELLGYSVQFFFAFFMRLYKN